MQAEALRQTGKGALASQPVDEDAERAIDRFFKLVESGALLTPASWEEAQNLSRRIKRIFRAGTHQSCSRNNYYSQQTMDQFGPSGS
jgi:hypothetical protein